MFRGNMSPAHSLSRLHLNNSRIKPLILRLLCFCLVHPTVQKQLKYFCFGTMAAAALHAAPPPSPLCSWPCWPDVPTMAPVGTVIHGIMLRIETPDSPPWKFRTKTILLLQLHTFQVNLVLELQHYWSHYEDITMYQNLGLKLKGSIGLSCPMPRTPMSHHISFYYGFIKTHSPFLWSDYRWEHIPAWPGKPLKHTSVYDYTETLFFTVRFSVSVCIAFRVSHEQNMIVHSQKCVFKMTVKALVLHRLSFFY